MPPYPLRRLIASLPSTQVSSQGLYIQALALPLKVQVLPILLPLIKQVQIPIPIPEQIQVLKFCFVLLFFLEM